MSRRVVMNDDDPSDVTQPAILPGLSADVLGMLMPMFLWMDPEGLVQAIGPTLRKVFGAQVCPGARFFDLFRVTRPQLVRSVRELPGGGRLHLGLTMPPHTALRGMGIPLPGKAGVLLNLSFGLSVADAVRDHGLTDADFAPTDLTVEMLYLLEAKTAVMGELRGLTLRLEQARRAAVAESLTDPLTGLANRRAFELALSAAVRSARTGQGGFAIIHLDLDLFKRVNDTLGHAAGDAVLIAVAQALRDETRSEDVVARIGGDEFVLLLPGLVQPTRLMALARRIIGRVEEPVTVPGHAAAQVSASIGAIISADYRLPVANRMLSDADRALYASKNAGRGRATILRHEVSLPDDFPPSRGCDPETNLSGG